MNKFETNPFERSALTNSELLAARTNELRQIRFILRNASKQKYRFKHLLITGNRGVGKTSFLNIINDESPTYNLVPIKINLTHSNSSNSNEFFWNLFIQTIRKLFKYNLLDGDKGAVDIAIQKLLNSGSNNDLNDWVFKMPIIRHNYLKNKEFPLELSSFIDDLGILINEIGESDKELFDENTKIIYLIDEAQQIFDNHLIIEEIRYIIQEPNLKIGFVFAGDNSYQTSKWENVFGGTQRDFEILDLNYFSEPRAVQEYFSRSLNSVGWTQKEIEITLFYRFQRACMQIYTLTSGKPSWINVIASKMFERCMKGETTLMKFDRQAQEDVKELLSKGGFLDSFLIDFINNLSSKYSKWLRFIFASELSTLDEVFFYAKYIITGADILDKNEFREFCQKLVEKNIIILIENSIDSKIGYNKVRKDLQNDILQKRFIAFGYDSDKLKQWLQINTNGHYHFSVQPPEFSFINQINSELVCDGHNSTEVLLNLNKKSEKIDNLNIIITSLNEKKIDIDQFNNHQIFFYYKLFKRLRKSRERQILYVELGNVISSNSKTWMVYNYDEHQNIIGFNKLESRISKYIENIKSFNTENEQYNLKITIQYLDKPNGDFGLTMPAFSVETVPL